jgi:xylulokinase
MLLLGIDIGTSSVKVSVVDTYSQRCIATTQFPETEAEIISLKPGWAEQSPDKWWAYVQQAIVKANALKLYDPGKINAIGIAYQMHGLVCIDKNYEPLRNSIIWCDSRAVNIGNEAFDTIGHDKCLSHLLNSPGNFTAAKLAWVKANEPKVYEKIYRVMLPGDYIAMKFTGSITTSISALSEGVFWDFKKDVLSEDVFNHFDFDKSFIPKVKPVFGEHGKLLTSVAKELSLTPGIPITYKAGDQPNNALSLNVMQPGEVAATAGTSGVIYSVADKLVYDKLSRINSFAHVNYTTKEKRVGVLLCINGTGILNKWVKNIAGNNTDYAAINNLAATVKPGSDGLIVLPFGNGAERMLQNKIVHSHIQNIDFNIHTPAHIYRAAQEGIAFAFRYGLDIIKENGIAPQVIKAGHANMFLSDVFTQSFVNATGVPVELYNCDGSVGAAIGAGIGSGLYSDAKQAFGKFVPVRSVKPKMRTVYDEMYMKWKQALESHLSDQ